MKIFDILFQKTSKLKKFDTKLNEENTSREKQIYVALYRAKHVHTYVLYVTWLTDTRSYYSTRT